MALVLIVDDDARTRRSLSQQIRLRGHEVIEASDGIEALDLFKRWPIDVMITDLLMPNKEGLELIQEARMVRPEVKFIALAETGRIDAKCCIKFALGMGADRAFVKPINPGHLQEAIEELLEPALFAE